MSRNIEIARAELFGALILPGGIRPFLDLATSIDAPTPVHIAAFVVPAVFSIGLAVDGFRRVVVSNRKK